MAQPAVVQLVPSAEGKWTANVQGVPAPGMAEALRALADQIERATASNRGLEALRAVHAAQESRPNISDDEIEAEVRAARSERRAAR
ncbi:MAG: hypothetical protein RL385_1594 [Pseudomonadota bacterium]|jgi:6-phosphogluconate dehydrogenase (decarboxylating)